MTRRIFELVLNTVCECFLVFCAIVMLLTGGWYTACALFILLGCLYRLYRALCPRQSKPSRPAFQYGRTIYDRNSDGSRGYPY